MLLAALERAGPKPTEARASALVGAGLLASDRGDRRESFALLRESLACARTAGSTRIEVIALNHLAFAEPDREKRIRLGKEAIALALASGDRWLLGDATGSHGLTMLMLGETETGIELTEEACRLSRESGDVSSTAIWLANLASSALLAGDTGEARARLNESLELVHGIDGRWIGMITVNLGWVELLDGDLDAACSRFEEGAALARRLGIRAVVADAIRGFAQAAAARGDLDRSARLAGAASALGMPAGFDPASTALARHLEDARATLQPGLHLELQRLAERRELIDSMGKTVPLKFQPHHVQLQEPRRLRQLQGGGSDAAHSCIGMPDGLKGIDPRAVDRAAFGPSRVRRRDALAGRLSSGGIRALSFLTPFGLGSTCAARTSYGRSLSWSSRATLPRYHAVRGLCDAKLFSSQLGQPRTCAAATRRVGR